MAAGSVRAQAFTRANLIAGIMLTATCPALGQTWPTRPMTMVVPFAAGSSSDIVGRIVAPRLSELLGATSRCRECRRCGRHDRRQSRGQGRARWLSVRARHRRHSRHQSDALPKSAIQRRDGFCAGCADRRADHRAGRAQGPACEQSPGVRRVCEIKSGEDAVRLARRGLCAASLLCPAQFSPRHQRHACSLPRRPAGHPGPDRRPDRLCVLLRYGRDSADREPDIEGARNPDQGPLAKLAGAGIGA